MDKIINRILDKINKNGYEAYIVGGYVRDKILKIDNNDIDICTNMLPDDIIKLFKLDKNNNYGSINIKLKKYNIDITTYRKEYDYDGHHPKKVEYINDVLEDLKRRDFTCNTLLMDKNGNIIDYYNGITDINKSVIRALRLSIVYNFNLDDEIIKFIDNNKEIINSISYYRKKEELDKIFSSKNKIEGLSIIKQMKLCDVLGLKYDNVIYTNNILGIYAQINYKYLVFDVYLMAFCA